MQFTSAAASRHSHPNWSPDRTRIAYTVGPAASDKHIAIRNVISGVVTDFTTNDAINEDNPSWSPDGTRIAYTSEVSDGSGQSDILVERQWQRHPLNLTGTGGELEGQADLDAGLGDDHLRAKLRAQRREGDLQQSPPTTPCS